MLAELRSRKLDFPLPAAPNFSDDVPPHVFDEERFTATPPLPSDPAALNFMGYVRPGSRGVGTRNLIVLLGTSSLTGAFVRALETRLHPLTTICQSGIEMGQKGANLLLDIVAEQADITQIDDIIQPVKLIVRQSTGQPLLASAPI
jgi:hypothetical protein